MDIAILVLRIAMSAALVAYSVVQWMSWRAECQVRQLERDLHDD